MGIATNETARSAQMEAGDRMLRAIGKTLLSIGQGVVFLLVVLAAVFSVSELAARDTALNLMTGRVSSLRAEFVERASTTVGRPVSKPVFQTNSGSTYADEEQVQLARIESIELLRRKLLVLSAVGANSSRDSLRGIIVDFQEKTLTPAFAQVTASLTAAEPGVGQRFMAFWADLSSWVTLWSSDQLLAISVMACGAIGAMIAMLRTEGGLSLRIFILGLAAGFITFLAIKGGKHVFILQSIGDQSAFNPYGTAFAGLIAGLFTEKAYIVLSHLVDELSKRLTGASGHQKQTGDVAPIIEKKFIAPIVDESQGAQANSGSGLKSTGLEPEPHKSTDARVEQ